MKKATRFLATVFGTGYLPYMPGTIGTLWGVPLFYLIHRTPHLWYGLILVIFIILASLISHIAGKDFGVVDDRRIVIDEVVGYIVTMFTFSFNWKYVILGFVLFRAFDVLKPFPINYLDKRITNGFGVVIDDVLAGVYANLTLQVVSLFL